VQYVVLEWPDAIYGDMWNCETVIASTGTAWSAWESPWDEPKGAVADTTQTTRCWWEWNVFFPLAECELAGRKFFCPKLSDMVLFTWYKRWWLQPHVDGYLGAEDDALQGLDTEPVPADALASVRESLTTASEGTSEERTSEERTSEERTSKERTSEERISALMDAVTRAGG
jgi:hypothetical protein